MSEFDKKLVENHWSKVDCSAIEKNFYCFPAIRSRSCKLIFGESDAGRRDWCEYWTVEKYLKDKIPFEKCLSICCGFGENERFLSRLNVAKKIVGIDIAPGAIQKAKEEAIAEQLTNIEYYVADLNNERLPENEYDIIWANGALHHIKELDFVIQNLQIALKNGGYLISNEYVGPNYQQIEKRQQEIINAVKHLLPMELCLRNNIQLPHLSWDSIFSKVLRRLGIINNKLPNDDYTVYGKIWEMPTIEYYLSIDPSECVNSNNIISTLRNYFNTIDVKYFDGSIVMYALDYKFYENYDFNNSNHKKLLELLFHIEDTLIANGELPRDNAHIICKKG